MAVNKEAIIVNAPALSTMWMQRRHSHVREFIEAGKRLGFRKFELGHVVRPEMLDGVTRRDAEFPSLHAPCPTTVGLGGQQGLLLSALDKDLRLAAVGMTIRTLEVAERLGAGAVVVHIGRVDVTAGRENAQELRRLYMYQQEDSLLFELLRKQAVEQRSAHAPAHLDAARRSLEVLADEAEKRGLRLGLENRDSYYQMPTLDEMQILLSDVDPAVAGYWHDVGHAQILDRLGFIPHRAWLDAFRDRLVGIHFHDALGVRDHLVCGLGEADWSMIKGYLTPATLRTCEFDWYFEGEHLWQGVEFLEGAGCLSSAD